MFVYSVQRPLVAVALMLLTSCAVHLRPPAPDLPDRTPVRPAAQLSHLAAVARLPHPQTAKMVDAQLPQTVGNTEQLGMLNATWQIRRQGLVTVRGDERSRLCFDVPFAGKGSVAALGQTLERELRAQLIACARPVLDGQAVVRLAEPDARVLIDRSTIGGPLAMLLDAVVSKLQGIASQEVLARIRGLSLPAADALLPVRTMLHRPIALPQSGCLKLRPQAIDLAQPVVDPSALRIGAAVSALPTAEQPCAEEVKDNKTLPPIPVSVVGQLQSPATSLVLPIAVGLDVLEPQLQQAVTALGKVQTEQGWMQMGRVQLSTSKGQLLVRAQVKGEVQDKFLFIPIRRAIDGELLLWGTPQLGPKAITLPDLQLDLQTDDRLVELAASLKRSTLLETVREKLMIPREKIDVEAKKALASMAQHVEVGGQLLPVVVRTDELTLLGVAAVGQRLEVTVKFAGQVTVGETAAR